MARKIKGSLQLNPTTTAPLAPVKGEMYYNDTDGLKVYDGNRWK